MIELKKNKNDIWHFFIYIRKGTFFSAFCFVCFLSTVLPSYADEKIKKDTTVLPQQQERIDMAINALSNMVMENGRITYEIDFLQNKKSKKNNIVREMGSAYALAFAYNQTKDKRLEKQLISVLKKAQERCVSVSENTCFISDEKQQIKVGSTALALLAELYFEQTSQDFSFSDFKDKMVNALISSYQEGKGVAASPFEAFHNSPYYDGETWFALSVYNIFYPKDKRVADVLKSMDKTMFKIYQDQYLVSFVHWGTMAASHRFYATKDKKFITFLKKQFDLYVKENPKPRRGSSTCSVTEGLSDTVYFLAQADIAFGQDVFNRIAENKNEIYNLQVTDENVVGKNQKNFSYIHPETQKYIGAFKNTPDDYFTRNDITQHCLIALLKELRASKKVKQ